MTCNCALSATSKPAAATAAFAVGVEEHGSVAIAGEEHGPAPSILSEEAGERDAQLLMSSECQGGVAAERDQQVEGVARDDQGAGAFRTLEGAGEHQRG